MNRRFMNNKILILALVVVFISVAAITYIIQNKIAKSEINPENSGQSTIQYRLLISYNAFATEKDFNEVKALLRGYDKNLQHLRQLISPPIDIVFLKTNINDFCNTVKRDLEAKVFVQKVACQEWKESPSVENP